MKNIEAVAAPRGAWGDICLPKKWIPPLSFTPKLFPNFSIFMSVYVSLFKTKIVIILYYFNLKQQIFARLKRFCSISHNTNQFKLQYRIFKRIFSSKGAHFAARFARIFHLYRPLKYIFAQKKSGAGAATVKVFKMILLMTHNRVIYLKILSSE